MSDSSVETMLLSEAVLAKDWDTPEEDEAWEYLDEIQREFVFDGYSSGDCECFCFDVPPDDFSRMDIEHSYPRKSRFHEGLISVYPDDLLSGLGKGLYRFKVRIEAKLIGKSE